MHTSFSTVRFMSALVAAMLMVPYCALTQAPVETTTPTETEAVNAFTMDLYGRLAEGNTDNIVISPFSVSFALSMTMAGARGETAEQMSHVLHTDMLGDRVHAAFHSLFDEVTKPRTEDSDGQTLVDNILCDVHAFIYSWLHILTGRL